MAWFLFGLILLLLNLAVGIIDIKNGKTTVAIALPWFITGMLFFAVLGNAIEM